MRRPYKFAAVSLLFLCLHTTSFSQTGAAPTPVTLSLVVVDKKGKPVKDPTPPEITIRENKKDLRLVSVKPDTRPLDLYLMIDNSGSVRQHLAPLVEFTFSLISQRQPTDRIAIGRFIDQEKIETLQDFTDDEALLRNAFGRLKIEGGRSAVIDATYYAITKLARSGNDDSRRKVLVLITDGEDRGSRFKESEVLGLIQNEAVQVFALGLTVELDTDGGLIRPSPKSRSEKLLRSVTEESGGRSYFVEKIKDLPTISVDLSSSLRAQWQFTFEPETNTPGLHKIEVKFTSNSTDKKQTVVRRGYLIK